MTSVPGSAWYWFGLGVLAVWRITHFLHAEHGPWGLLARGRAEASRLGIAELFACFYCLSFWTAAPFAWWLGSSWQERLITWFALSASAILIEVWGIGVPPDPTIEEDKQDDMLRK